MGVDRAPDLLTIEEATRVLRIGRTKAYAMAREWRATGGRCGLPVIDFGNLLRVPRHALEELIGARIEELPALDIERDSDPGEVIPGEAAAMPTPTPSPDARSELRPERSRTRPRRQRRAPARPTNQLDLFGPDAAAS